MTVYKRCGYVIDSWLFTVQRTAQLSTLKPDI